MLSQCRPEARRLHGRPCFRVHSFGRALDGIQVLHWRGQRDPSGSMRQRNGKLLQIGWNAMDRIKVLSERNFWC